MLHQFFVAFLMFLSFLIIYGIIKVVIPLSRLLKRVDLLEDFFLVVKKVVSSESSVKKVRMTIQVGRVKIYFSSKAEACEEIEKLAESALEAYDQIKWFENINPQIYEEKEKIFYISKSIKRLKNNIKNC